MKLLSLKSGDSHLQWASSQRLHKYHFGIFAFLFAISALISADSYWTESEVWSATVSKYFLHNPGFYDFGVKPLTNALLFFGFKIAQILDVHPMDIDRVLYGINFLLLIYISYLIVRRISPSSRWTGAVMMLFVANSYLIRRGAQVRSDLMTSTAAVLYLSWCLTPRYGAASRWTRLAIFLIFSVIALSITPKSITIFGPLFLIQFCNLRARVALISLTAGSALMILARPELAEHWPALRFVFNSGNRSLGEISYFNPVRLVYVRRYLSENPYMLLIWARALLIGRFFRKQTSPQSLLLIDLSNWTFLILAIFPDRLPFFIAGLTPFWLLSTAELPKDRWAQKLWAGMSVRFRQFVVATSLALALASWLGWNSFVYFRHNADAHHAYVHWIRQFEPQLAKLNVYDPAGIIPFLPVHHWFLGPGEVANQNVVDYIKNDPPDVILVTDRFFLVEPILEDLLQKKYFHDGAGLLVRRTVLVVPNRKILNGPELWEHIRGLVPDKNGQPLENFHLEIRTQDGLDVSRFAKWRWPTGSKPFSSEVTRADFINNLEVPPGATDFNIYPIKIATPFSIPWMSLFRFDTEN